MVCSVSQAEIDAYAAEERKKWEREGRWDLLVTKEELAGWLCDEMRGHPMSPECNRWWLAHLAHNDSTKNPGEPHGDAKKEISE